MALVLLHLRGGMALPQLAKESFVDAIVDRVRVVLSRQPGHVSDDLAQMRGVDSEALRDLVRHSTRLIDIEFLIDVLTAIVRELAIDPQWLLTGEYEPAIHRHALILDEDRSAIGARLLRDFVRQQYQNARESDRFLSLPLSLGA